MNCGTYILAAMPLAELPDGLIWIIIIGISTLGSLLKKKDSNKGKEAPKAAASGPSAPRSAAPTPQQRVPAARPAQRRHAVAPPPPRPMPKPPAPKPYTVESLRQPPAATQAPEAEEATPAQPQRAAANPLSTVLDQGLKSRSSLRAAIVLSEILAPPKALRDDDI